MDSALRTGGLHPYARTLAVSGLICLLAACDRSTPVAQSQPRSVLTMTVGAQQANTQAVFAGIIAARNISNQGFRVPGAVLERLVEVGQHVRQNQPLLQLDPSNLELTRQQALAQLDAAKSKAAQARVDLNRDAILLKQHFISQAAYDRDKVALDTANAQLQAAQAQYDEAANQLDYGTLRAAVDGVVTSINVDVGDIVNPGKPAVGIARDGDREVVISVPESRVRELRDTRKLSVTLWAVPDRTWRAELRDLDPAANKTTGTYDAHVTVIQPDASMLLGMTAYVHLEGAAAGSLYAVPLTALAYPGGKPSVWVLGDDGAVSARTVTLGGVREDSAYIAAGLRRGEVIVTVGGHLLHEGEKLIPTSAPSARE